MNEIERKREASFSGGEISREDTVIVYLNSYILFLFLSIFFNLIFLFLLFLFYFLNNEEIYNVIRQESVDRL